MKKDDFKEFVKSNPKLIKYVKNNEMTWQKFYELYDLYGSDESIWKEYLGETKVENKIMDNKVNTNSFGLNEVVKWFKNVDLDGLQEGIGNVQRVLGVVQDFSKKDSPVENTNNSYKPRPLYKHFED